MADRELMQQARDMIARADMQHWSYDHDRVVLATLDERLAQPEQEPDTKAGELKAMKDELWKQAEQQPISLNDGRLAQYPDGSIGVGTPHPAFQSTTPRREWVGLTEEEIMEPWPFENRVAFARWLEAKLKEKNT